MIGKVRVLRQQRAMHVRAENVSVDAAFAVVLAVVAVAGQHLSQRTRVRAEIGAAAVVLEADEGAASPGQRHVTDAARCGFALVDRPGVENANSFELRPLGWPVEARKELVATADSKHRHVCLHRGPQALMLHRPEIAGYLFLLPVLAATDKEHVKGIRLDGRPQIQRGYLQPNPTPGAALCECQNVAAVAIDIQLLGIQMPEDQSRPVAALTFTHPAAPSTARRSHAALAHPARPASPCRLGSRPASRRPTRPPAPVPPPGTHPVP